MNEDLIAAPEGPPQLTDVDLRSVSGRRWKAVVEFELARKRAQLEGDVDQETTWKLRGAIRALQNLINVPTDTLDGDADQQ